MNATMVQYASGPMPTKDSAHGKMKTASTSKMMKRMA